MFAALLVPSSAWAADPTARIIVQHEPGLTTSEQKEIRSDVDATLVDTLKMPRTEVIAVDRHDLSSALRRLNRDPNVAIAEQDRVIHSFSNDPDFTRLWGLENTGQTVFQTDGTTYTALSDVDMNIPEAWDMSFGTGRTVAVVDSGVLATHPDLVGRIGPGYDWVDEDNVPNDPDGHGTHVTGTIAATVNNGRGIAGIAPQSRVLPLRVLNANGAGFLSDIIDAFQFAGQQGVRVVNASLGGSTFSTLEKQAIDQHPDTLFVVAAGNSSKDVDVSGNAEYPCSFTSSNVLCVGAHWARDGRAWYSNYGRQSVDVYAPGTGIYSTSNNNAYAYESGTSMAAPHVAGLAALLLARNPLLSTADLKTAIMSTVHRTSVSYVSTSGGRVDANEAVGSVPPDRDGDAIVDEDDNCIDVPNFDQTDSTPGDGTGDACEDGAPPVNSDGDGVLFNDACPQEPGTVSAQGCPGAAADSNHDGVPDMFDTDGDGIANARDNCPTRSNRNQADADRDRIGDVCDSTPRGPDADGDGKPLLDDKCPTLYARTADGCPVKPPPVIADTDQDGRKDNVDACPYERAVGTLNGCPLPAVTALSAKSRKRGGKRYVAIAVRSSRGASVKIRVLRKKGKRWVKVMSRTRTTNAKNRVSLTTKRLKRGRYRVAVVLSSAAGSAPKVTRAFRVR